MRAFLPTWLASSRACCCLLLALSVLGTSDAVAGGLPTIDIRAVPAKRASSVLRAGWQHGAMMEIFVRGYKDSNGDGMGDLRGLTQQLPYLQKLGIKGIWLMPIMASEDHDHGYATTDYRSVEPAYGNLRDVDTLIREAHRRGIGVIIDYVINHSASSHPLFIQSAASPNNAFRDWYVWQNEAPTGWDIWGNDPWFSTDNGAYYATFGAAMPDFNLRNPKVVAYHEDSLRFWLNRGLDGFRLDAVPHLIENNAKDWNDQPESRALTHRLQRLINRYPQRYVVCEATADPKAYGAAEVCGSAFAFGHQADIVNAAKGDTKAIHAVADYFLHAPMGMATMVSNHDIFGGPRLWDQVAGDVAQYKLAAATYLLQPGTPFIYYGEEIGMASVSELLGDGPIRAPMSWTADDRTAGFTRGEPFRPISPNHRQQNAERAIADPQSLFYFYRDMLQLRNRLPSIAQGSYVAPQVTGQAMHYQRQLGREQTLVVINYGNDANSIPLSQLGANRRWRQQYPASHQVLLRSDSQGTATLAIPAQSVSVFRLQH